MGHAYDDLNENGKKLVVERQENIVFEQNSKNLIKRRQTVVREKSTRTKTPDTSPKERLTNIEEVVVDGNTVEAEVEIIKKKKFQDRLQHAYKQLGCLEASFNHEIEKLKQQRSLLRMSLKPSKKKQKKRSEDQYLLNVSKSREEIGVERFSQIHQCVCTSPRYGGIEELSCRPRTRTVSSQIEKTPPLNDRGAVGDHVSANKIPEKYSTSQDPFKNNSKSLKELEIFLTSPEVTEDTNLFYKKENDQIVNYCYCNSNNNNVVGSNCYNNSVSCNQRNYQESGTTGGYDYNYCRNEYYRLNPCVQSNNQYTNNAQPRFVHCCPKQMPININCGRKRTDIGTEHYFNVKSPPSPSSPRTPSPTSKRNGKCRIYENLIKAELEKELQQQFKKTKEKDIKKQCKELSEEREKTRGQEKRRTKSNERQRSRLEECELRQKLFERLQNESATKLVELLDRYVDEKDEMKSKKHKRRVSEKVTTRDDLAKVRSQEKLCQITLRKRRVLQQNLSPEQGSSAASSCPEYFVESVECYKQPSRESQYSLETLRMLKKMRITEYKPIKLKTKPKLDKSSKKKQYNEYINKYKREEAEIKPSTPISEEERLSDSLRHSPDKISNNYGKNVDSGIPKDERFNENFSSEYNTNESKDEGSQQTRGRVAPNREEPVNYDEFKKEMDKQLLYTPSPRDTYSSGDKSTRTFTKYETVKPETKDEGIQAHSSFEDSPSTNNNYSSISKIQKALLSLKEFLNNYREICPEEDEKLNELQATANDVISKIVVCKGVTTNTSSKLNTIEKQSKLGSEDLKQSEKVSEEVQTENNETTEDNLNTSLKKNDLKYQSPYVEENFEDYSCRGQQQQQYQQAGEEVYQCGTEYEESNGNRENGINLNSAKDMGSPLLHTTYEEEYYCLPEPIYVNTEVSCDPCIDFKNECKNSYTSQPQIRTPRTQADGIPSVGKESQSKPLKYASPSRPQTFSASGSVDLCPDSFSQKSCTAYMDCLSSTVIHKRVDAQTTTVSQPNNNYTYITPRNSNAGSQNTSPSYQYSPGCALSSGTPKDRKSPNKCTKQENASPLRGILKPSQLIGCEQRTIESQTSRIVKDNDSDQRSVSISSSTTQLLYQKNENGQKDSEESVSCKDRRNQPLGRKDISQSPHLTKTSDEKVGSEHSQLNLLTNGNKNISQPSCTCCTDVTINKQPRQSSMDCMPAFNHCSCMQDIYCNLLELYCKSKEREKRKNRPQYARR